MEQKYLPVYWDGRNLIARYIGFNQTITFVPDAVPENEVQEEKDRIEKKYNIITADTRINRMETK